MRLKALRLALLACSTVALAACESGGSGGVASAPPPSDSPSPTPTPAASYPTVADLSRNDTMAAAGYKMEVDAGTGAHVYSEFAPGAGYQVAFSGDGSLLKLTYGTGRSIST